MRRALGVGRWAMSAGVHWRSAYTRYARSQIPALGVDTRKRSSELAYDGLWFGALPPPLPSTATATGPLDHVLTNIAYYALCIFCMFSGW